MGACCAKAKKMMPGIPGFSKDYTLEWKKPEAEEDAKICSAAIMTGMDDASFEDRKKTYLDACLKAIETFCTALAKEKETKGTILCAFKEPLEEMEVKDWEKMVTKYNLLTVGKEESDLKAAVEDPCSLVKAGAMIPWAPFTNAEAGLNPNEKSRCEVLSEFLVKEHGFGPGTQVNMEIWASGTLMHMDISFDDPVPDCKLGEMGLAHRMKGLAEGKPPGMGKLGKLKGKCACLPCCKK